MADLVFGEVGKLSSKLVKLAKDEYNLQSGVRHEVESLSKDLNSMEATLCNLGVIPWSQLNEQQKDWAGQLREAYCDIEDIIDSFHVLVDGVPQPADNGKLLKDSFNKIVSKVSSFFSKSKDRHNIAIQIQGIRKNIDEIAKRRDNNNFKENPAMSATRSLEDRRVYTYRSSHLPVGISGPVDRLITKMSLADKEKKMKTVCIVGPGGLGKTTLAKAVLAKLKPEFECTAFVPVGMKPDMKNVFKRMLIALDEESYSESTVNSWREEDIMNEIENFLKHKRFLIVIDDIWDTRSIGDIKKALMSGTKQNRILVTSRTTLKTRDIDADYRLKKLSYGDSRKLFYTIIYGDNEDKWPDLVKSAMISDKILQKCDGLPFAIVIIASLLATKKDIEEWSDVYDSIGFENGNDGVEDMMKILSYSYYDLPPHLKDCLLHLSVYPEDVNIAKVPLIWKWIGEGLVVDVKGIGLFQVGEIYFHELIDRSMILPVESGFSYQDCCYVHDIVLHMIRDLSRQQNFAVLLYGKHLALPKVNARCRRLAMTNVCDKESGRAIIEESKTVRSFNATASHIDIMLPPLRSFKVLRVLSLEVCHSITEGKSLKHLGELTHLRYLGLTCTPIRELPEEVGCLKHLQALRLKGTGIEMLPARVGDLTQLLCLSVDGKTRIPRLIGKMHMLVHLEFDLETDDVSAMQFVTDLGKRTELTRLCTKITVKSVELRWALLKSLGKLHKVEFLNLASSSTELMSDNANLDGDFALSKSIRFLKLTPFGFFKLPEWINSPLLTNLCDLILTVVSVDKKAVHILGKLQKLRSLFLFVKECRDDEGIITGIITCASGAFPNLQSCKMNILLKFDEAAMPRLEYLKFMFMLVQLMDDDSFDLDFGLQNLHSLQHVVAEIDCTYALHKEVEHVDAALREIVKAHPNRPTLKVQLLGEHLVTTGADSNMLIRKKRMMQHLRHRLSVQDSRHCELKQETTEVIRSIPRGHPCLLELYQVVTPSRFLLKLRIWYLAQLQEMLLRQHFFDTQKRATREYKGDNEKHTDDLHKLMEMISAAERALKLLKEANETSSEVLKGLKSSLRQLCAADHDGQEEDAETEMQDTSIDGHEEEDTETEMQDSSIDGYEEVSELEEDTGIEIEDSSIDGHEEVSEPESGTESSQEDVDLDFAVGLGNVDLLKQLVVLLGRTDLAAYYSALPQTAFVSTQLAVQRNLLYELNRQTEEVTRSIPRGLPYLFELFRVAPSRLFFAKLRHWYSALLQERALQQHLADTLNRASRGNETIGNVHRLMQSIDAAEQAVEIYTTRNRRSSAMLEELKSSLSHLRSDHFDDEESDDAGVAALAGDVLFCLNATKTLAIRWLWRTCVAPVTEAVRRRFRKKDNVRAVPATSSPFNTGAADS